MSGLSKSVYVCQKALTLFHVPPVDSTRCKHPSLSVAKWMSDIQLALTSLSRDLAFKYLFRSSVVHAVHVADCVIFVYAACRWCQIFSHFRMVQFTLDRCVTRTADYLSRWRLCLAEGHITGTVSHWLTIQIFSNSWGFEQLPGYFKKLIWLKVIQPKMKASLVTQYILLCWCGFSITMRSQHSFPNIKQFHEIVGRKQSWIISLKTNEKSFISKQMVVRDVLIVSSFQKIWLYLIWFEFIFVSQINQTLESMQLSALSGFALQKVTARPRLHNLI